MYIERTLHRFAVIFFFCHVSLFLLCYVVMVTVIVVVKPEISTIYFKYKYVERIDYLGIPVLFLCIKKNFLTAIHKA